VTTVCIDLDNTITSAPAFYKLLMDGLRGVGAEVHVLSGVRHSDPATQADAEEKKALLDSLGCGDSYDELIVVSGPEKKVPGEKVGYMRHVGAVALFDNSKANITAARKAGFIGLRHQAPK